MRQLSVVWKFREPEIYAAIVGLIRDSFRHEIADHRDHLLDVLRLRRRWKMLRPLDPQRIKILEKRLLVDRREIRERPPRCARVADRLVIHVGEIHHPQHVEPARFQMPLEQILENVSAKISDVRVVIDRRSAGVHPHEFPRRIERRELFQFARVGVMKADGHFWKRAVSRIVRAKASRFRDYPVGNWPSTRS